MEASMSCWCVQQKINPISNNSHHSNQNPQPKESYPASQRRNHQPAHRSRPKSPNLNSNHVQIPHQTPHNRPNIRRRSRPNIHPQSPSHPQRTQHPRHILLHRPTSGGTLRSQARPTGVQTRPRNRQSHVDSHRSNETLRQPNRQGTHLNFNRHPQRNWRLAKSLPTAVWCDKSAGCPAREETRDEGGTVENRSKRLGVACIF